MIDIIETTILNSAIVVCSWNDVDGNDWSDEDVNRGFSWRSGSVSFGVPDYDGSTRVEIFIADARPLPNADTERAVVVPFTVGDEGIVFDSMTDTCDVDIRPGVYSLWFSLERPASEERHIARLVFFPPSDPPFCIVVAGGEMVADAPLPPG